MHEREYARFFTGLRALVSSAFPKRCGNCGRVFETPEQFLAATQSIHPSRSGLKAARDEDGSTIIEAFRNCPCGSTLLDYFSDRRDLSAAGERRRQRFAEQVELLVGQGIGRETARTELLKILRGEYSELLASLRPDTP